MEETDLNNLLINAEQLALNPEENIGELPKIERTLKQVYDATNELWSRLTSEGLKDNEANLLLSTRGVDLPHLSQKLERITARRSLQPLDPTPITDIDAFLKNELDNSILAIVDHTSQKLEDEFIKSLDNELKKTARDRRLKFLNCFHGYSELDPDLPITRKVYPLKELYLSGASNMDQYQIAYAEALIEYRREMQSGKTGVDLISKFMSVIPAHDQKIRELWKITSILSQLPWSRDKQVVNARIHEFELIVNLTLRARSYLEENYKVFMEEIVKSNMLKACRGGEPGTYSLVRSFVKAGQYSEYLGMEQVFVDGLPFWPVFYYCLRCGDLDAALHCLTQLGNDFGDLVKIISEMKNSPHRRLSTETEINFIVEYTRMVRNTPDPFKRIVYCVIGGCDVDDKHREVVKTTDDYLWLRLCQIRRNFTDRLPTWESYPRMTYVELQRNIIQEYDIDFEGPKKPYLFFQVCFLVGLFEQGINVLYRNSKLANHAVHIAIALSEVGILSVAEPISRPIISTFESEPLAELNLYEIIKTYVNTLPDADVGISLHYLFSLRNLQDKSHSASEMVFPKATFDLLIKTEKYDQVLGYFEADGCKVEGLYEQFTGSKFSSEDLITSVAAHLETKGDYFTAMKLYELCGNYEKVMWVWCTQMNRHLLNPAIEEAQNNLYAYSEQFLKRTDDAKISVHAYTKQMFDAMHLIHTFYQYYNNKEFQKALSIIQQSKFLPLSSDEVELKVNEFKSADMMLIQPLPTLLICVMKTLTSIYRDVVKSFDAKHNDASSYSKAVAPLREKASAVTSFAGRLPFQFKQIVYSRLMALAVSIR